MFCPEYSLTLKYRRPFWWLTMSLIASLSLLLVSSLSTRDVLSPWLAPDRIQLPLAFVPNVGQSDPGVHFEVRDLGGTVFFTAGETVLALPAGADSAAVLRLQFEGANPAPTLVAAEPLSGIVNYFLGDDAAQWRTNVPTYAGVTYQQLYPGIDLHYAGTSGQLKSTFVIAPRIDPNLIRWRYEGASRIRVDRKTGDLIITVSGGELIEQAPVAWQELDGQLQSVRAGYRVSGGLVSLRLGRYDKTQPLIIDPAIDYSTYLGGSGFDLADALALDSAGNVYVTGSTTSTDFPTHSAYQDTQGGDVAAFVSKLNPNGSAWIYSTYLGGSGDEEGTGIAVDSGGYAYVTGCTDSSNFPLRNALQGYGGLEDAFLTKLNSSGNGLVYSTYLGGGHIDEAEDVALHSGSAYVVGTTFSDHFRDHDPQHSYKGWGDTFVAKVSADGSDLVYLDYIGGSGADLGTEIAVDADGRAYALLMTTSSDMPTVNPYAAYEGQGDLFVAKLNGDGSALTYGTYLGGSGKDTPYGIDVDSTGHAYVTGSTESADYPTTTGAFDRECGTDGDCNASTVPPISGYSHADVIVTKLATNGSSLAYSTYIGGHKYEKGYDITVDSSGRAVIAGDTDSNDLLADAARPYAGESDAFVLKLSANGNNLVYGTYLGGSAGDYGTGVAIDGAGAVFVTGTTLSDDFPTQGAAQADRGGYADAFVVKLTGDDDPPFTPTVKPNLIGSFKSASRYAVHEGASVTWKIHLRNSGAQAGIVDVVDTLPDKMSCTGGAGSEYDADAGTLTWFDVEVPEGDEIVLTFDCTADEVDRLTPAVNSAEITVGDNSFVRRAAVMILPFEHDEDWTPPILDNVTITDRDVLTSRNVKLHITASDNNHVKQMCVKEWTLVTEPWSHWGIVQSKCWIPYQAEYDWQLTQQSGTHFIGVWVADEAGNISHLDSAGLDSASLLLPNETVERYHLVPYLVYYEAGTSVSASLTPSSGDADLYVWYAGHPGSPVAKSTKDGTATDAVHFVTEHRGIYVFVVRGHSAATYNFEIAPGGGTLIEATAEMLAATPDLSEVKSDELVFEPILSQIGPDPLAEVQTPEAIFTIYLPLLYK